MSNTDGGRAITIATPSGPRFARLWGAEVDSVIAALHGIESHAGWFGPLGCCLARLRIGLLVIDRHGSGADLARRGSSPGIEGWLDDVQLLAREAKRVTGATDGHLLGHSWGAKCLALAAVEGRIPSGIRSALLLTPGLFRQPAATQSSMLDRSTAPRSEVAAGALIDIPLRDEQFSDQAEVRALLASDPLRLRQITSRFVIDDAHLSRRLLRSPQTSLPSLPLWLGLAEHDRIVDEPATRNWFQSIAPTGRCLTFAKAGHLVLLERPHELAERIRDWLQEFSCGR